MENKQLGLVAVVVIAIIAVALVAMPALSEQVYAGSINSDLKNKGKQGEFKSDGKRQGHGRSGGGGGGCDAC
ncbi:MAG TPA: hypothetical protein VJU13_04885 [Candidatus Nitrosocosmicus sp.]|nr:hypothetical protein [Candidatus Nitrosocosmicus sp.]